MQQSAKAELRRQFLERRREFTKRPECARANVRLRANLRRLLKDLSLKQFTLFAATETEAGVPFSKTAFYPVVACDEHLHFYQPKRATDFKPSRWRIKEPDPKSARPLDLALPTAVCCPAVALDWHGGRMGLGKGYYDRFLSAHPHFVRVGLSYQIQVTDVPLPADRWDEPLDWIVTDQMILRTTKRRSHSWT